MNGNIQHLYCIASEDSLVTPSGPSGNIENNSYVSFGEAMQKLEDNGVSPNIASYLGATTVRIQEIGYENRKATDEEMESMRNIVKLATFNNSFK